MFYFLGWKAVFTRDNGLLMTPGLILGVGLLVLNHNIKSVFALPAALLVIPAGFYAILYASGNDLDDARLALGTGWVANVSTSNNTQFWHTWNGFQFKHVKLAKVLPSVISTWFAMFFVVAFGSCLDVAAIQMELGRRLDFNKELKTVGISNILSGLTGGFTGTGTHASNAPRQSTACCSSCSIVAPPLLRSLSYTYCCSVRVR